MTDHLCPDCEYAEIRSYAPSRPRYVVTRPCPAHQPEPTPAEAARAEVEAIAARHLAP